MAKRRGKKRHRRRRGSAAEKRAASSRAAVGGIPIGLLASEGLLPVSTALPSAVRSRTTPTVLAHLELVRSQLEDRDEARRRL